MPGLCFRSGNLAAVARRSLWDKLSALGWADLLVPEELRGTGGAE